MRGSLRERKPGVWELRAYAGSTAGKKRYETKTFHGGKRAAESALREWAAEVEKRRAAVPVTGPTVKDALEGWWRGYGRKLDNADTPRTIIDTYLAPLHDVELSRLRGRLEGPEAEPGLVCLTAFYEGLVTKGGKPLAASSVARVHGILRLGLGYAVRRGWLDRNAAVDSAREKMGGRTSTTPEADVLAPFMAGVARDRADLHAWLCLVGNGARPVEVHALRWRNVDRATGVLSLRSDGVVVAANRAEVRQGETKKRRRRDIQLDTYALASLATWEKALGALATPSAYIFSRDGGLTPRYPTWARQAFKRAVVRARAAGLALPEGIRPYDLRHFLGTQAIAAGVSAVDVAQRMGNSARTVHASYAHPVSDSDRRIAGLMGSVWLNVAKDGGNGQSNAD